MNCNDFRQLAMTFDNWDLFDNILVLVIFCVMLSLSMPARTLEPEFVHRWLLCGGELMHLNIEFLVLLCSMPTFHGALDSRR